GIFYKSDKLYRVAGVLCVLDIVKSYLAYSRTVDILRIDMPAERQRAEDTKLSCSVVAVYIGGWVLFGIAQRLSLSERLVKGHLLVYHLCEYIVCGSVQNSRYLLKAICGKAF